MKLVIIFLGGGLGSTLRYGLGHIWKQNPTALPYSTLLANVTACIIIGILLALQIKQNNQAMWLLLATGFCGGLSTFSTFSMETIVLFQEGNLFIGIVNIALTLTLCLLSVWFIARLGINPVI